MHDITEHVLDYIDFHILLEMFDAEDDILLRIANRRNIFSGYHTTESIHTAGRLNHLSVVKWVYEHGPTLSVKECEIHMKWATKACSFDVMKWWHESIGIKVFPSQIDHAGKHNRLDIVMWMMSLSKRSWRDVRFWSAKIYGQACINGNLDMVKLLHNEYYDYCCANHLAEAANNGHFEVVKWLFQNCRFHSSKGIENPVIVKWLIDNKKLHRKLALCGKCKI